MDVKVETTVAQYRKANPAPVTFLECFSGRAFHDGVAVQARGLCSDCYKPYCRWCMEVSRHDCTVL